MQHHLAVPQTNLRVATSTDADAVQRLRKHAWRARYQHPQTGVTQQVLNDELAVLPPTGQDLERYRQMLNDPRNHERNLVVEVDSRIVGTVTYQRSDEGVGEIGVPRYRVGTPALPLPPSLARAARQ